MALRILLADSTISAQKMGKKILVAAGYDVITVSNGLAAIKEIAEVHPDIVLLDVYMAGSTGVEVCQKMKVTPGMTHIPILLTAGKLDPFRAGEAKKLGAAGLIIKPFEFRNLITVVDKLAECLRPLESASVTGPEESRGAAGKTRTSTMNECPAAAQRGPEESQVADAKVHSPSSSKPPETVLLPSPASRTANAQPALSGQHNEQVCDVCGHVNRDGVYVCQQCDVPLPSSVIAPGLVASHLWNTGRKSAKKA